MNNMNSVKRIAIIGNAGSGKSTLTQENSAVKFDKKQFERLLR